MLIKKGTRKTNEHGFVFIKCDKCGHEHKLDAEEVMGTIQVLEDMFDNL